MNGVRLVVALSLALAVGAPGTGAGEPPARVAGEDGLTATESAGLEQGHVVAKVIDTFDRSEVMTVGAVRVRATKERFLACARDPGCLRRTEDLMGAGRLGTPPSASDLAGLAFDRKELEQLRECRIGDCELRFSADAIERLQRDVDWSSPDRTDQAAGVIRRALAFYASSYLAEGNRALPVYRDGRSGTPTPVSLSELLARRWFLLADAPELRRYLIEYPHTRPPAAEDFVSWYREKSHRLVVTGLNHNTVYEKDDGATSRVFVASKQLYASHYYESSLELMEFVANGDRSTLFFMSRSRADIRSSGFNWPERLLLRRIVRWRVRARLRDAKVKLEASLPDSRRAATQPAP